MLREKILVMMILGFLCANGAEYDVTPNSLATLMKDNLQESNLVLRGTVDVRDFKFINDKLESLKNLDISAVSVAEYKGEIVYFGELIDYSANEIPPYSFFGKDYTSVILPSNIQAIGEGAFGGCSQLTGIVLPNTLTTIGNYAFSDCDKLATIELPSSITSLGRFAFNGCDNLQQVISASSASIPSYCFKNCKQLTKVELPASTTSLGAGAFSGCNLLSEFNFPESLISLGEEAFKSTSLQTVDLSLIKSLNSIGGWAFADNSSLLKVIFPESLATIGQGAFFNATSLNGDTRIPQGVTEISDFLFNGCASVNVKEMIPVDITTIGKYAFADCNAIQIFTIPSGVKFIDDNAFQNCTSLEILYGLPRTVPQLGTDVFVGINQPTVRLRVYDEAAELYRAAEQWKEFKVEKATSSVIVERDKDVKAYFVNDDLVISAYTAIQNVMLYDVDGHSLVNAVINKEQTSINTSNFGGSIYLLSIKLADNNIIRIKLIRQ
ncbi:MAG: leucine-rich repeat domain-containing protein [Muribaculaceae bacterium]|nr:leucine-rich repeat domain-containing protein [Muribaculaceae bacterium]